MAYPEEIASLKLRSFAEIQGVDVSTVSYDSFSIELLYELNDLFRGINSLKILSETCVFRPDIYFTHTKTMLSDSIDVIYDLARKMSACRMNGIDLCNFDPLLYSMYFSRHTRYEHIIPIARAIPIPVISEYALSANLTFADMVAIVDRFETNCAFVVIANARLLSLRDEVVSCCQQYDKNDNEIASDLLDLCAIFKRCVDTFVDQVRTLERMVESVHDEHGVLLKPCETYRLFFSTPYN